MKEAKIGQTISRQNYCEQRNLIVSDGKYTCTMKFFQMLIILKRPKIIKFHQKII